MIFDQYSRYYACAELLRHAGLQEGASVLDVGSGPECLFGNFIPEANVTYVDPLIRLNDERHISGNIFSSQLNNIKFSYVTAIDVFEHVPAAHRIKFLNRVSTLSNKGFIVAFPSKDNPMSAAVDKAINDKYYSVYSKDYPWLKEHADFGLPSVAEALELCQQAGWQCQRIKHGRAEWLIELLGVVVCVWDIPELNEVVLKVSEKFNHELASSDFGESYYRDFILATKVVCPQWTPSIKFNEELLGKTFKQLLLDAQQIFFNKSLKQLAFKNIQLQEKNCKIEEVSRWALGMRDSIASYEVRIAAEKDVVKQLQADVAELNNVISSQDRQFVEVNNALSERDNQIVNLNKVIFEHDRQIQSIKESGLAYKLKSILRNYYHQLPLPPQVKQVLRFAYHKVLRDNKIRQACRNSATETAQFAQPAIKPVPQEQLPDYVVWGIIDWHFRHQRPQHLALSIAATGRRVFYISAIILDNEKAGFEVEQLDTSGRLFQVKLYVAGSPSIYTSVPQEKVLQQLRDSIGELLLWTNSREVISLVQHPYWTNVATVVPNSRVVYDCMDHHDGFGNTASELVMEEQILFSRAELTITTSSWLYDFVAKYTDRRAMIRNACEYEHFATQPSSPYRDTHNRLIIGYYGAIAEWFDIELIKKIAIQFKDCCVMLVGADTAGARQQLSKYKNVIFTGEVRYSELPYYLYGFDVCILPFKVIPLTLATNPVKVYEYLSAGKSVVSVDLPEMRLFGDLVTIAGDTDSFLAAVKNFLDYPPATEILQKRKAFAKTQTWTHRGEALIKEAEDQADEPKVSIIIVTYNNLGFTKACLYSIEEYTDYPALEIIVVDNASTDGSKEYLSEWASHGANRQFISNDDNKGFAAANNQGLRVASGDYLVLLNNDTYVTPGWIRTLLTHLKYDSKIGLIGPVTNNIGNEAKIDIHYPDTNEMLKASAQYTCRHIGQTLPLRTVAFFCVMMPRSTYETVGELDEAFGRGFFEDDDYCRRVEAAGLKIVCAEDVFIHHHFSASFNKLKSKERQALFEQNKAIYEAKWGKWIPHVYRSKLINDTLSERVPSPWQGQKYIAGYCIVCGKQSRFFYQDESLWREFLTCEHCRSTSRYRSIARGLLSAINEFTGFHASSLTTLQHHSDKRLRIYDTQPPFYYEPCAYPLPDILKETGWIDVELSQYKPKRKLGEQLAKGITNQNLECLTYDDESLDIVITSDVMEHVRLDERAHHEIYRVLKPGGFYLFTVPHVWEWDKTLIRVKIIDPDDPSKDIHLLEPEYHGDTNSEEGSGVLAYRTYGKDLEALLTQIGFEFEYTRKDIEGLGIMNTELFCCRKAAKLQ